MKPTHKIALHILSLVLMVLTIYALYKISPVLANAVFWAGGCFAFGWFWKEFTDLLIEAYDETNT